MGESACDEARGGYSMTFRLEHRPLQAYTDALADAGFVIERLREVGDPDPSDKWHRIPLPAHPCVAQVKGRLGGHPGRKPTAP
jgi:hypothetical protein